MSQKKVDEEAADLKAQQRANLIISDENSASKKHYSGWFRGKHTNFNPSQLKMTPETAVHDFVLKGWLPPEPIIDPDTQICAFGSCFAANISHWMARRNYRVLTKDETKKEAYVISIGEGMVNSFVLRQQFEWAWDERTFDQPLWHGYDAEEFGYDEGAKAVQREIFDTTDVFILTLGLSEVWYDDVTGEVFSRTIPKDTYDASRHKFRVSTVEENRDNIEAIYQLIRKHRPDAKILFTLSPIPLIATFRDNSAITSNSVSKAVLRVAVDEVCRAHKDEGYLYYWPSYEIVMDVFHLPYKQDRRHVEEAVLRYIMTEFEHRWCKDAAVPPPPLLTAWIRASAAAGLLPARLARICKWRSVDGLEKMLQRKSFDPNPERDAMIREMLSRLPAEWEEHEASLAATEENMLAS